MSEQGSLCLSSRPLASVKIMNPSHHRSFLTDAWRAVATLEIAVTNGEQPPPSAQISDCLRTYSLPPAILERLRKTVEATLQGMVLDNSVRVLVHIYCLTAGDESSSVRPSWGFFLVEKHGLILPELVLHVGASAHLDIYIYQENAH